MLRKCVADGNGVTNDTKTINKLGLELRRNDSSIEGLDVKKNLSDQRKRVVTLQRERVDKLNEIKSGLGTSMEANEAERAFHRSCAVRAIRISMLFFIVLVFFIIFSSPPRKSAGGPAEVCGARRPS